jgi:sterol desaturase/sphingolipid hydroxylase (fatty acid hydroxylase superfamily)
VLNAIYQQLAIFGVMGALSLVWGESKQPLLRRDLIVDILYFLMGIVILSPAVSLFLGQFHPLPIARYIQTWPFWVQSLVVLFALDGLQTALHRWMHEDLLWPVHQIHHSSTAIDVMSGYRHHPLNHLIGVVLPSLILLLVGFPPATFAAFGPLNFVLTTLLHANLSWDFGPLRYVFVSPMYHRWHHAIVDGQTRSRNYAGSFPIWDLLFGTYYMPRGKKPVSYGAPGAPETFLPQLLAPFKAWAGAAKAHADLGAGTMAAKSQAP